MLCYTLYKIYFFIGKKQVVHTTYDNTDMYGLTRSRVYKSKVKTQKEKANF